MEGSNEGRISRHTPDSQPTTSAVRDLILLSFHHKGCSWPGGAHGVRGMHPGGCSPTRSGDAGACPAQLLQRGSPP